jgi:hypothetical protein
VLHDALSKLSALDQIAPYRALHIKDVEVTQVDPREVLHRKLHEEVPISGLIKLPSVQEIHRRNAEFREQR